MIIDRILQIVELEGISKRSFYTKVGLSNGFLDKPKDVGASKIVAILKEFPHINPLWLLMGEGQMLTSNVVNNSNSQNIRNNDGTVSQINNGHNNVTANNSNEIELLKKDVFHLRKENEQLKKALEDKEEIIRLLKR